MKNLGPAKAWAIGHALPLWSSTGRDGTLYHERLDFERRPTNIAARRLMVQARQIATYSRASLEGWHQGADEHVVGCLAAVERHYHRADAAPGWVFSVGADHAILDPTRDLYAHAFILYALAWSHRLTGDPQAIALADQTLDEIDVIFAAQHGGFLDAVPAADAIRRQNPHMHLLEALLALHEATGAERYMDRAGPLVSLAQAKLIDPRTGALLEDFASDWSPLNPHGANRVEPGHQFEWAWLLEEYRRLGGDVPLETIDRLLDLGLKHGFDAQSGLVIDAVTEAGERIGTGIRSWPHAEGVKAFGAAALRGRADAAAMADRLLGTLMDRFAPDRLMGGWIDRFDAHGRPMVDHMPASTLYHLMGAIFEADRVFGANGLAKSRSESSRSA